MNNFEAEKKNNKKKNQLKALSISLLFDFSMNVSMF